MTAAGYAHAEPKERLLLRGARQIVTLQGPARIRRGNELREIGLIRDGSILIEGGRITQVGSARRLDNVKEASLAPVLDARQVVIVPGFIDAVGDLLPLEQQASPMGGGAPPAASLQTAPLYQEHALNQVARSLDRQFSRLARLGTMFTQFRLRVPEEPRMFTRLLRNLLQLDLPRGGFRAELHFPALPRLPKEPNSSFESLLPRAASGYWKALSAQLSVSLPAAALEALPVGEALHAIRRTRSGLPFSLSSPESCNSQRLLALSVGQDHTVIGALPGDALLRREMARFDVPWIVYAGESESIRQGKPGGLRDAVDAGMRIALGSGYDVNRRGAASPIALSSTLSQQGGMLPEEILVLSIANLAYAMGEGHRMGSIQTGMDANLVLLDCDDYREIGRHTGFPPVLAAFRRGVLLRDGIGVRS